MKIYEQAASLFWLLVAAFVLFESMRMGVGTARAPGMGFMPFYGAAILGILSLAQFAVTLVPSEGGWSRPPFSRATWLRVVPALLALLVYALVLPKTGLVVSTFVLMLILFWLAEPARKWAALLAAFLTTLVSYLVLQVLLDSQFPKGPWGF